MRHLLVVAFFLWAQVAQSAVIFYDPFNRADTTGTMEDSSGNKWKDQTANFEISDNKVRCRGSQACSAVGALVSNETTSLANVVVSAQMLHGVNAATGRILCRNRGAPQANASHIGGFFADTTAGHRINKIVDGVQTVLTVDAAQNRLASARLQIECVGNAFTLYENGVSVKGPVSDSDLPTGFPGIFNNTDGAGAQVLDNFAVCDAVAECDDFSRTGIAPAVAGGPSGRNFFRIGQ